MPNAADEDIGDEFDDELVFRDPHAEAEEELTNDVDNNDQENVVAIAPIHNYEVKGIHFKICNPGVAECKLKCCFLNPSRMLDSL